MYVREILAKSNLYGPTDLHDPPATVAFGGEFAGLQAVAEGVYDLEHVVLVRQKVLPQRLKEKQGPLLKSYRCPWHRQLGSGDRAV